MSGQTTNGAGPAQAANGAGPASRYQSALDHPVGAGTFVDRNSLTSPPEVNREPDQTDSREQAVLMRAFTQANATLAAAQERLGADGVAVVNAYQKAHAAVAAVERFTIGETSQHAQGKVAVVRTRHAQDGPESRQRRTREWRLLAFVTGVGSGAFDTVFVGTIIRRFFGIAPDTVSYWLSYVPGMGMAISLYGAAGLLAESVFRWRNRADRTLERTRRGLRTAVGDLFRPRTPRTEHRAADDLPWPNAAGPVALVLALFSVIGAWAAMRARYGAQEFRELAAYQPMIVIFIVVLSVATVVAKVLAHNPFADRAREAGQAVAAADREFTRLLARARRRLVAHTKVWLRLDAAVRQAETTAHAVLEDAYARIVEERADSGRAGHITLPLARPVWPWPAAQNRPDEPGLHLELLVRGRELLETFAPEPLHASLRATAASSNAQFRLPGPGEASS